MNYNDEMSVAKKVRTKEEEVINNITGMLAGFPADDVVQIIRSVSETYLCELKNRADKMRSELGNSEEELSKVFDGLNQPFK